MTKTAMELKLSITGMTCGSCRKHVEGALLGVRGVQHAFVDLEGGAAYVRYDPWAVSPAALAAAVRSAGYGVEASGPPATRAGEAVHRCAGA